MRTVFLKLRVIIISIFTQEREGHSTLFTVEISPAEPPFTVSKLKTAAWRIETTTRNFNLTEGATRKDHALQSRLMNEPVPPGPAEGHKAFMSKKDFEQCLDRHYKLHGWDRNGIPTSETVERLEINMLIEQE